MKKVQTKEEARAAADAAKLKADEARVAADAAPDDADLKKTADDLQKVADDLDRAAAAAPSHEQASDREQISKRDKRKRRMEILLNEENEDRKAEGKAPLSLEEFSDDMDDLDVEDEDEPEDAPVTKKDLERLGVVKSVESLVAGIKDAEVRAAVQSELRSISAKLPAEERFQKALAIVSSTRNTRIAAEAQRMAGRRPQQFSSGSGSGRRQNDEEDPDDEGEFKPTALEKRFMDRNGLSKADILKSRRDARNNDFGQKKA